MLKEGVQLQVPGNIPPPYREYIRERNGLIARQIAGRLKVPYVGERVHGSKDRFYQVPAKTLIRGETGRGDLADHEFYGGIVDHVQHVEKAVLHPNISASSPLFYSPEFARSVRDLVLPGFTAFTKDDAIAAIARRSRDKGYRLKLPNESDGQGQYEFGTAAELEQLLGSIPPELVAQRGVVVESNLTQARTISVGYATFGDNKTYSFVAQQKNAAAEGRQRYLGAHVVIFPQPLSDLAYVANDLGDDPEVSQAIQIAFAFHERYSHFNPVASRLSYDYLTGVNSRGDREAGVTDITARLGGTCPVLTLAAAYLDAHPEDSSVRGEVHLNYHPEQVHEPEEGAMVYIDHPTLRLSARLTRQE